MATNMDKSLDEILGEQPQRNNRNYNHNNSHNNNQTRSNNNRRRDNNDFPRDGVKKAYYKDEHRDLDSEWVHDRYEDNGRRHQGRRRRDEPDHVASGSDARGTKIRVENIHYELSEEELKSLFQKIGPVVRFQLRYDRAGRSEGVAYVTYESHADAKRAVSEYNGANANGQPISLTIMTSEPKRNPFDNAIMPGRSLADRISDPRSRSRSRSPRRHISEEDVSGKGIDRYVPGQKGRSRSPMNNRRNQGRRPGARRENQGGNNNGRGGQRNDGRNRSRKTQEELDAEMADYFGSGEKPAQGVAPAATSAESAPAVAVDDVDMIE